MCILEFTYIGVASLVRSSDESYLLCRAGDSPVWTVLKDEFQDDEP